MIDIEQLQTLNNAEQIAITEHARRRLVERGISVNDIIRCIELTLGRLSNNMRMISHSPAA